jgi:CubicO group peptidase (beta-lactamase class C family)
MTTVAVMQCVEKGLLKLDDDVAETYIPEFKGIEVLVKIGDDGPVLRRATRKVTLRYEYCRIMS